MTFQRFQESSTGRAEATSIGSSCLRRFGDPRKQRRGVCTIFPVERSKVYIVAGSETFATRWDFGCRSGRRRKIAFGPCYKSIFKHQSIVCAACTPFSWQLCSRTAFQSRSAVLFHARRAPKRGSLMLRCFDAPYGVMPKGRHNCSRTVDAFSQQRGRRTRWPIGWAWNTLNGDVC